MNLTATLNALEELKKNDHQIGLVFDQLERVEDEAIEEPFLESSYGVQLTLEDWRVRLISPPAIAREHNNCWSVILQMRLWERWMRYMGTLPRRERGQRLLAETIHHTATELPFIPNPIETHPMIDGLTSIFGMDDNMTHLDHTIRMEVDSEYGQEFCEIRMGVMPKSGGFPKLRSDFLPPLPPVPKVDFDSEIARLFPKLKDLPAEELMKLYHLLLMKDRAIRCDLPYDIMPAYYPLKRRSSSKKKAYQKVLDENPFRLFEPGVPIITTKAPFRSYEQYSSDLFIKELYQFLSERRSWYSSLQDGPYDLLILQGAQYPDGDNIPFDRIHRLLKVVFKIPMTNRVDIRYAPKIGGGVSLALILGCPFI